MRLYREVRLSASPIQAVNYAAKTEHNKITRLGSQQINFACDVELAMQAILSEELYPYMLSCYGGFDLDEISIEQLASKVIHGGQGRCQNLKHRCAKEFLRRGIAPLSKYMKQTRERQR